jgi:hypothetical protein
MLLTVRLRWGHIAYSVPVSEECFNSRPEATSHQPINLRQPFAFKLWHDPAPMFFRLR